MLKLMGIREQGLTAAGALPPRRHGTEQQAPASGCRHWQRQRRAVQPPGLTGTRPLPGLAGCRAGKPAMMMAATWKSRAMTLHVADEGQRHQRWHRRLRLPRMMRMMNRAPASS